MEQETIFVREDHRSSEAEQLLILGLHRAVCEMDFVERHVRITTGQPYTTQVYEHARSLGYEATSANLSTSHLKPTAEPSRLN